MIILNETQARYLFDRGHEVFTVTEGENECGVHTEREWLRAVSRVNKGAMWATEDSRDLFPVRLTVDYIDLPDSGYDECGTMQTAVVRVIQN